MRVRDRAQENTRTGDLNNGSARVDRNYIQVGIKPNRSGG